MTKELFLEDSYLKECEAEIIAIDEDKITLDQTVFYPAGGGQESDAGILIQDGIEVEVIRVKKESGQVVHHVREPGKLTNGPVTAKIDWERRNQSMKHHTLLHVLASVFHEDRDSLCTGNQIYPDKARIDLTGLTELSKEEIENLVERANLEISRNHEVSVRILPRAEAEQISGMIKTIVNLIPEAVEEIRLVKIGDIDEQACGGTHVNETQAVGQCVLDKVKNKGKGVTRLEVRIV